MKTIIFTITILISFNCLFAQDKINIRDSNGLKQGKWLEHFPKEEKFDYDIINYENGLKQGVFKAYRKDSTLYMKGNFVDDKLHGEHYTYYQTGQLKIKTHYLRGKENGKRIVYNKDGSKYSETEYLDNLRNGNYILYYSNGNIQLKGEYTMGKKTGIWKKFSKSGEIIETNQY